MQDAELLRLLSETLVTLEKDYSELKALLDEESWQAAGRKAHQLKGSAYLYECPGILFFLERITEKNAALITTETFKNNFWQRSRECLGRLQQAIDKLA